MGRTLRVSVGSSVAAAVAASLWPAAPALAAPGDASARGVVFSLRSQLMPINAEATIGSVTAPAGGGTESRSDLPVVIEVPTEAAGRVAEVSATRGTAASSAISRVVGFDLRVTQRSLFTAGSATATVNCPQVGTPTADLSLAGITIWGEPVTLVPNGPWLGGTGPIHVGVHSLSVRVGSVVTVTADRATASLRASLEFIDPSPDWIDVVPVGSVILAEATCDRPALAPSPTETATPQPTPSTPETAQPTPSTPQATQPAPPALQPTTPALPVTGSSGNPTGLLITIGASLIIAGATARLGTTRLRRRDRSPGSSGSSLDA